MTDLKGYLFFENNNRYIAIQDERCYQAAITTHNHGYVAQLVRAQHS